MRRNPYRFSEQYLVLLAQSALLFLFALAFLLIPPFKALASAVDEIRTMWAVPIEANPRERFPPLAAFARFARFPHWVFSFTK